MSETLNACNRSDDGLRSALRASRFSAQLSVVFSPPIQRCQKGNPAVERKSPVRARDVWLPAHTILRPQVFQVVLRSIATVRWHVTIFFRLSWDSPVTKRSLSVEPPRGVGRGNIGERRARLDSGMLHVCESDDRTTSHRHSLSTRSSTIEHLHFGPLTCLSVAISFLLRVASIDGCLSALSNLDLSPH